MTFEEYVKSDEGKRCFWLVKRGSKKTGRGMLVFAAVLMIAYLSVIALDFIPEEIIEESRWLKIHLIASLCLCVAMMITVGIFLLLSKRKVSYNDRMLSKALALYWQENEIPWNLFISGSELFVKVESFYSEGYGAPKRGNLSKLVLSDGEKEISLDIQSWDGALDGAVSLFIAYSLVSFLQALDERGESFQTVRIMQKLHEKTAFGRKMQRFAESFLGRHFFGTEDGYIVKKGKLTRLGREYVKRVDSIKELR